MSVRGSAGGRRVDADQALDDDIRRPERGRGRSEPARDAFAGAALIRQDRETEVSLNTSIGEDPVVLQCHAHELGRAGELRVLTCEVLLRHSARFAGAAR